MSRLFSGSEVNIGLVEACFPIDQRPGQSLRGGQSFGISSRGGIYNRSLKLFDLDGFHQGDTIGLGLNIPRKELFFTKNGVFISRHSLFPAKVIQLTQIHDYFPSLSLDSMFSRVRLNFGKEPFHFDFERYVQMELASLLRAIEEQPISKDSVKSLLLDYTQHHGYLKTYEILKKLTPVSRQESTTILRDFRVGNLSQGIHKNFAPRSYGDIEKLERKSKESIDIQLSSTVSSPVSPLPTLKRARKTVELGNSNTDLSFASQRGLIRGLMVSKKFLEAEKLIKVCFPALQENRFLQLLFQVYRFIHATLEEPLAALEIAKTHFVGQNKEQKIFIMTPSNEIVSIIVKVKWVKEDLMVLLVSKPLETSILGSIYSPKQAHLGFDVINIFILEHLGLPRCSKLEKTVAHLQLLGTANIVAEFGFQGVIPSRYF
jgi:hypothetical protein